MAREFEQTLEDIDTRCRKHKIPYAIIGGTAANIYGLERTTVDIDVTIIAEIDELESIVSFQGLVQLIY